MIATIDVISRLVLAVLLGSIVGLERESINRPAGFRTHVIVCVGSALIMMVSVEVFNLYHGVSDVDPSRIAAQVVSGIGFIGAGTILREGVAIKGLTTAASLWTISGIGLAAGLGLYIPAVAATVIIFLTLSLLNRIESLIIVKREYHLLRLVISDTWGQMGVIGNLLGDLNVNIKRINISDTHKAGEISMQILLQSPGALPLNTVVSELAKIPGVHSIEQRAE